MSREVRMPWASGLALLIAVVVGVSPHRTLVCSINLRRRIWLHDCIPTWWLLSLVLAYLVLLPISQRS